MKLPIYQIDAFAEKPFEGNPAAVVPLDNCLPEETMQAIAEENNLAETAFLSRLAMVTRATLFSLIPCLGRCS